MIPTKKQNEYSEMLGHVYEIDAEYEVGPETTT